MKTTQRLYDLGRGLWLDKSIRYLLSGGAITIVTLIILGGHQQAKSQTNPQFNGFDLVDKTGNIRKPADYRHRYQALGTFSVVDLNGGTDLHYTYVSPGTAEYYRKYGK